mgnify:CR=1 FL=1
MCVTICNIAISHIVKESDPVRYTHIHSHVQITQRSTTPA